MRRLDRKERASGRSLFSSLADRDSRAAAAGLAMYGYDVLTADGGEQASATLRDNKYISVLVTDADLDGDIDGVAIARLTHKMNPKIDVIYTARAPHRIPGAVKVSPCSVTLPSTPAFRG
jgi:DNA-binding NtrC family response regulator